MEGRKINVIDKIRKEGIYCSTEPEVIKEKSSDLTYMSPLIKIKEEEPICIAFPKNEEEVVKLVEIAIEEHVPLIPRGAGKNNIGGVLPLKKGIIVETEKLYEIKDEGEEITLGSGVKIIDVYNKLRVYPSTYKDGVTVGGNYEGGCGGIGAFRFGRVWYQATEVDMVNPKGKLTRLKGGDVLIAAHAEGTTGIITKLKMLTYNEGKIKSKIILFDTLEKAIDFVSTLYDEALPVYHVTLRSPEASKLTNVMPFSKWNLLIAYPDFLDFDGINGSELWNRRDTFYGGLIKTFYDKNPNTTFYITFDVYIDELYKFLDRINYKEYVTEFEFIQGKLVHPFFINEEKSKIDYLNNLLSTYQVFRFDLHSITINNRLRPEHLQKIKTYKRMYDKEDLFNPGKIV
ncbi:FAD-binding oxidoreductase [Sulfurisphaera javensis]|uniref:FAD-binding oxidoreductase n=1 Tax=Sulfurisphaera javensis TaxID=2049879 RepID=A0AAT9GT81_9CREN